MQLSLALFVSKKIHIIMYYFSNLKYVKNVFTELILNSTEQFSVTQIEVISSHSSYPAVFSVSAPTHRYIVGHKPLKHML